MHSGSVGGAPCQGRGRGFNPVSRSSQSDIIFYARVARLVGTTLPRSGSRVRVRLALFTKSEYYLVFARWLSWWARPCQGRGRGFESRLALFFKSTSMMCFFFLTRTRSRLRIFAPLPVRCNTNVHRTLCTPSRFFLIAGLEHSRSSLRSAGRHCTGTAQPQSFSVYCDRKDGCRFRQPPLG